MFSGHTATQSIGRIRNSQVHDLLETLDGMYQSRALHTRMYVCAGMHVCIHACTYTNMVCCNCVVVDHVICLSLCIYIQTYIHTYIHTNEHTYIHTDRQHTESMIHAY